MVAGPYHSSSSGDVSDGMESEVMRAVVDRSTHVHARIGTTQCPQVRNVRYEIENDAECVRAFVHHWRAIRDSLARRGMTEMSITPEYGPHPYAPSGGGRRRSPSTSDGDDDRADDNDEDDDDVWDDVEAAAAHVREVLGGEGGGSTTTTGLRDEG